MTKTKKSSTAPKDSFTRKFFRGIFKAIFWLYTLIILMLTGLVLFAALSQKAAMPYRVLISFQNARSLLFLLSVAVLVFTLIGSLFKLLRKRTIFVPLLAGTAVAVAGQVVDYTTRVDAAQYVVHDVAGVTFGDTLAVGSDGYGYPVMSAKRAALMPDTFTIEADNSKYDHQKENPVKITSAEPVSTFSIDVDTSSYANVRAYLDRNIMPPKDAIRVEEMINYFPYDYALPENKDRPFAIHTTLVDCPWKKGNKLLHIGIKGYEQTTEEEKPLNLVLLIDTSGSMYGHDRLDLLKTGFNMLVDQMTEKDTISIVTYAGSSEVLLQPTKGSEKRKIKSAISSLSASGGTWGEGGLQKAYELARANFDKNSVNRILLGTDGDFNIGNTRNESLTDYVSRQSKSGIYLSILNVGRNNYNDALMQKLAQNGNGVGYYLDSIVEAKRVLSDDIKKTLFPIADDVKIQVEFNPAKVAEYRLIGYETRLLNREDFNNDKVDAGEINAGHSVTAIYEITPVGSGNQLVDNLRYAPKAEAPADDTQSETAFVRVRYKLPGEKTSQLIEQPVKETVALDTTSDNVRFSIAVAAFAQKLRDSNFVDWDVSDIRSFAQKALGEDSYGYRQGFLSLMDKARALSEK